MPVVEKKKKIQAPKCFGYKDLFYYQRIVEGDSPLCVSPHIITEPADRCKNCVLADDCAFETDLREYAGEKGEEYVELVQEAHYEHLMKTAEEERKKKAGRDAFVFYVIIALILILCGIFSHLSGQDYGRYDYEDTSYTYGHPYLR